jgi:hypothetical protein
MIPNQVIGFGRERQTRRVRGEISPLRPAARASGRNDKNDASADGPDNTAAITGLPGGIRRVGLRVCRLEDDLQAGITTRPILRTLSLP